MSEGEAVAAKFDPLAGVKSEIEERVRKAAREEVIKWMMIGWFLGRMLR